MTKNKTDFPIFMVDSLSQLSPKRDDLLTDAEMKALYDKIKLFFQDQRNKAYVQHSCNAV